MPLCTKVELRTGHIVSHGDPAAAAEYKGTVPPVFDPCLLWANGRPNVAITSLTHRFLPLSQFLLNAWMD